MSQGNALNSILTGLTVITVRAVEGIDQPGRGSEIRPYKTIAYALAQTSLSLVAGKIYLFDCFGDFTETMPALIPNIIFQGNGGSLKINNSLSLAGSWSGVSGTLMFNGFSTFLDLVGGMSLNFSSSPSSMFKIQDCFITTEAAAWTITGNASNQNKSGIYIDYLPGMGPSITQTNMIILNNSSVFSASAPLSLTGTVLSITQANTTTDGYLSSADWNLFNTKQAAGNYITALTGDVTATGPGSVAATVTAVGGQSASNIASATLLALAATNLNTPSTIVKRDSSGNFSAGTITATLSGNATTATTAVNFSGNLGGDVIGPQSATVVANSAITNAKMANMPTNTFKANNIAAGAPLDLSITAVKAMLGISSSVAIANQQIGFGNSSSNLVGSNNIKWDDVNQQLAIPAAEINWGKSTTVRQAVFYDSFTGDLNRYYGISIGSGQFQIRVDQTATNYVFLSGLTSTTNYEAARVVGSGGILLPSTNSIATEPFSFTGAPHTLTFTFTGPWASPRTHPFSFYRLGRMVIMSWPNLAAQTIATSGAIQSATANGSVFVPSIYYPASASGRPVQRITVYNNSTGSGGEEGDIQFGSTTFGYNIVIRAANGSGFTTAAGLTAGSVCWFV